MHFVFAWVYTYVVSANLAINLVRLMFQIVNRFHIQIIWRVAYLHVAIQVFIS